MNDSEKPSVSILIPVYNRERFLAACLESVWRQTYERVKVIVFDDGSTDRSVEIARSFPNTRVEVGGMNRGISCARNQLLSLCDTPYAAWQDSDDISNLHRVEEQMKVICNTTAPIVYCRYKRFRRMGNEWTLPPWSGEGLPARCIGGALFQTVLGKQVLFDETMVVGEDLIWRASLEQQFGAAADTHLLLYYYRQHRGRITAIMKRRRQ